MSTLLSIRITLTDTLVGSAVQAVLSSTQQCSAVQAVLSSISCKKASNACLKMNVHHKQLHLR